ncbi:MAG TPA: tetratricopeptide repeat protein, partial [Isosphaeraceae bacterium]|nr:tetratricopeptide repeat protein [Isosphaeraceae bacterium]
GAAQFSPDSRRIVIGHEDGEFLLYNLATGQPSRRWRQRAPSELAFSPDGARIALLERNDRRFSDSLRILEAESGRLVRSIPIPRLPLTTVVWSPDGTTLATPCSDGKIYLWDAATGIRKVTLEGHTNEGLFVGFHPAGTVLASDGWERRLWLWDPVLGRPWLNLPGAKWIADRNLLSHDGRVILLREDQSITYQIDPALEYRTLAHPASRPIGYNAPSIRRDGRVLAVGTNLGVVLWDLARGTELAWLPIGEVRQMMFESSGELLTSGVAGVLRWPVRLDPDRHEFRTGPPQQLPLPATVDGIAEDHSGRTVALAYYKTCHVLTPQGPLQVGPLDDCRHVALSPDGQWLATGSHGKNGFQVWRLRDVTQVAHPVTEGFGYVRFSPDGKWLMTWMSPCRLWEVGTWREARQIGGIGHGFSPDGRLLIVQDATKAIRLVESETGRILARFESPDLCAVEAATFSPDGSRLVVTTRDGPAVHVWDLRAIRRHLAGMGLDWDAPAYSDDDPASSALPPLPPIQVELGPLAGHVEHFTESARALFDRYTARLQADPNDADAYHHRAHARADLVRSLADLERFGEAIADVTKAIQLRPEDAHLREFRGKLQGNLADYRGEVEHYEAAIRDLETALRLKPDQPLVRDRLALYENNLAWKLANGPDASRHLDRALALIEQAIRLTPGQPVSLNTLGVVQYRRGRYAEALATLQRSLAAGHGQSDGFDLFFLAMAHHRLGHRDQAKNCFDRAVRWVKDQKNLTAPYARELAAFQAEARIVLTDLPDDVFAGPR